MLGLGTVPQIHQFVNIIEWNKIKKFGNWVNINKMVGSWTFTVDLAPNGIPFGAKNTIKFNFNIGFKKN